MGLRCRRDREVVVRNPESESIMKRLSSLLACLLACAFVLPAQAHGGFGHGGGAYVGGHGGYGGWHGGGYRHDYYRGSWGNNWVAPVLGAALVGGALYAASTPSYVVQQPSVVVMPQQTLPPARVAYFCGTSQQYYPNVPSCPVPWQLVNY